MAQPRCDMRFLLHLRQLLLVDPAPTLELLVFSLRSPTVTFGESRCRSVDAAPSEWRIFLCNLCYPWNIHSRPMLSLAFTRMLCLWIFLMLPWNCHFKSRTLSCGTGQYSGTDTGRRHPLISLGYFLCAAGLHRLVFPTYPAAWGFPTIIWLEVRRHGSMERRHGS